MKKLVLLFCCLLCVGFGGRAMAAENLAAEPMNNVLWTQGIITAIDNGQVTVQGEGFYQEIVLNVTADTYINDGKRGRYLKLAKLAVGDKVRAYYGPAVTRSMPPQGNAAAIIRNSADKEAANALYIKAAEVNFTEDTVHVLNSNHDLIVRIDRSDCRKYRDIKPGDELLVWYQMVALSMPGQTNATKAVILEHK